jgi:hypothetical protein
LGKNQYVANNDTREGRKENRRVELFLMTNALGHTPAEPGQPANNPSANQTQPQPPQ